MVIRFATREQIECAATETGVRIDNYRATSPTRHLFVLRLTPERRWQRMNHTHSRKVAAVCWHGHRDFFRALFRLVPTATVATSRMGSTRYTAETFEDVFPETGYANIGSMFQPCAYQDACLCGE